MKADKILIVDDDSIIRMDLKEILLEAGYTQLFEAKNGDDAVKVTHEVKPDLIILDVKMPVMNGIKAANIMRKISDASILMLTAYSQKEMVEDAKQAGVSAYLVKPVSEEDVLPAVEIALSQRETMLSMKKDIEMLKQKMEDRKVIDRAKARLIRECAMDEEAAYRWLQEKSMGERIPLVKISQSVLHDKLDLPIQMNKSN